MLMRWICILVNVTKQLSVHEAEEAELGIAAITWSVERMVVQSLAAHLAHAQRSRHAAGLGHLSVPEKRLHMARAEAVRVGAGGQMMIFDDSMIERVT